MRRFVTIALAVALVATACGTDSDATVSTSTTAPTTSHVDDLLAAAVVEIATKDNSFGGRVVFDHLSIGATVDPPTETTLSAIEARLDGARIEAVDDPDALISTLVDEPPALGHAVVVIDAVRLSGHDAEVDLHLWCGTLCGVFLTYGATFDGTAWTITGPIGPVAVS